MVVSPEVSRWRVAVAGVEAKAIFCGAQRYSVSEELLSRACSARTTGFQAGLLMCRQVWNPASYLPYMAFFFAIRYKPPVA
jgi:hypothetical protein